MNQADVLRCDPDNQIADGVYGGPVPGKIESYTRRELLLEVCDLLDMDYPGLGKNHSSLTVEHLYQLIEELELAEEAGVSMQEIYRWDKHRLGRFVLQELDCRRRDYLSGFTHRQLWAVRNALIEALGIEEPVSGDTD